MTDSPERDTRSHNQQAMRWAQQLRPALPKPVFRYLVTIASLTRWGPDANNHGPHESQFSAMMPMSSTVATRSKALDAKGTALDEKTAPAARNVLLALGIIRPASLEFLRLFAAKGGRRGSARSWESLPMPIELNDARLGANPSPSWLEDAKPLANELFKALTSKIKYAPTPCPSGHDPDDWAIADFVTQQNAQRLTRASHWDELRHRWEEVLPDDTLFGGAERRAVLWSGLMDPRRFVLLTAADVTLRTSAGRRTPVIRPEFSGFPRDDDSPANWPAPEATISFAWTAHRRDAVARAFSARIAMPSFAQPLPLAPLPGSPILATEAVQPLPMETPAMTTKYVTPAPEGYIPPLTIAEIAGYDPETEIGPGQPRADLGLPTAADSTAVDDNRQGALIPAPSTPVKAPSVKKADPATRQPGWAKLSRSDREWVAAHGEVVSVQKLSELWLRWRKTLVDDKQFPADKVDRFEQTFHSNVIEALQCHNPLDKIELALAEVADSRKSTKPPSMGELDMGIKKLDLPAVRRTAAYQAITAQSIRSDTGEALPPAAETATDWIDALPDPADTSAAAETRLVAWTPFRADPVAGTGAGTEAVGR